MSDTLFNEYMVALFNSLLIYEYSVRCFRDSMHIRGHASLCCPLPRQHLISKRTIAYCPSFLLAIHRQQVSAIKCQVSCRLDRSQELQFLAFFHHCTIVLFRATIERRIGYARESTGCECEVW
jgi:hypothetical protein